MNQKADESFSNRVCALLLQLSSGKCPITEDMIRAETDENNASVLTGLQLLWEDLNYQAERRGVAERELRQREARYRGLFNQARVCIWDCDLTAIAEEVSRRSDDLESVLSSIEAERHMFAKAKLVAVNAQALVLFGAESQEQLADQLGMVVGERSEELLRAFFGALARREDNLEVEGVLYTLAGRPLRVVFGMSTAEGDLRQAILTIADISSQHEAREAAQKLAQLRADELDRVTNEVERLFYAVSHDLRAPARSVISLAEWAREDLAEQNLEDLDEHLAMIVQRAGRLDTMLNDLLSFAKFGRTEVAAEEVNVDALLREIQGGLVSIPEGFELAWSEMPVLTTQKTLLAQVLLNLVTNAIKHHDKPNGRIHVSHRLADGVHELSVADDGPGIPEAYREKIFGMFTKLKRRDEVEGSGMGLAFVHKVVTRRGGRISVIDTPGGGATFRFTWPPDPA